MSMRVQAAGRIAVDLAALGAHSLALSSHKLGGPLGAGALLLAPEVSAIAPLIAGGGQERGRRGGTPPLPAIAGFAAAAPVAGRRHAAGAAARCASSMRRSRAGAVVCGGGAPRLANTTCLALPGVRADAQVIALDLDGIAVSAGAACSSGKVATSHVLAAMGLGALAGQAIRVSLPWNATASDVDALRVACRMSAWPHRLAPRAGSRTPPESLHRSCMSTTRRTTAPEPPGLPGQPGHHALRPARGGRPCCPGSPSSTATRTASST